MEKKNEKEWNPLFVSLALTSIPIVLLDGLMHEVAWLYEQITCTAFHDQVNKNIIAYLFSFLF